MNKNKKYVLQRCMAGILSLTGVVACFTGCNNSTQIEKNQTEVSQTSDSNKETTEAKKEETTRVEEQKKLIDDEKYKVFRQDIVAIQKGLHIPDKYMEIPEVLDLIMQVISENENYMLGFTATDLDEELQNLGTNKVRYSVDGNFSYNETEDELIIFNNIDGQKHKKTFEFLKDNNQYFITDSIVFDKEGNPFNNVIITSNGFDFKTLLEDYIEYTTSEHYIEFCYHIGDIRYLLSLNDYEIYISIDGKSDKAFIDTIYKIKTTEDYKGKITKAFNERNPDEMRKIFDELIKNNPIWACSLSEIVTLDEGNPNNMWLFLDRNKLNASLCEAVRIHYDTYEGPETYINYLDAYEFEYTITDNEEEELAKYILNGDCDSAVKYTKKLDTKYKK